MINKQGGRKNFGYGKQLEYAIGMILKDKYSEDRFGTEATYRSRLRNFVKFLKDAGINDLAKVRRSDVAAYADSLREDVEDGRYALSTAVHHLSAVNVLMSHARHDDKLKLSPAAEIGRRNHVRTEVPTGLGITCPSQLRSEVCRSLVHGDAIAAVIGIARFSGARFREASLMPLDKALAEIQETRVVNVVWGCKGGRTEFRPVLGCDALIEVLERALRSLGRRFVIPSHWNYVKWKCYAYRYMPEVAADLGISQKFQDLRASYACARYREITGVDAPVVAGGRLASKETDVAARQEISCELGHCRIQICNSYIGSAR